MMHVDFAHVFAAGMLLGTVASCSSGTDVSISSEMYLHTQDGLAYAGGGCMHLKLPASGGAAPGVRNGDINLQEGPDGDSFLVQVFSDEEPLAVRRYDQATLQSGAVDDFTVTTHARAVYTFRYWGGPCTLPPNDLDAAPLH
jgi:hypothetical protein